MNTFQSVRTWAGQNLNEYVQKHQGNTILHSFLFLGVCEQNMNDLYHEVPSVARNQKREYCLVTGDVGWLKPI